MAVNLQRLWAEQGLMAGFGVVLAVMGPFGTFEKGVLLSLGYWVGITTCWFVLAKLAQITLARYRPGLSRRLAMGLRVLLATPPMMLVVSFANQAMGFDWKPTADELAQLFGQILMMGLLLSTMTEMLVDGLFGRSPVSSPVPVAETEADEGPAAAVLAGETLLDKLPSAARGRVLCLQMEDHYVRIHTDRGSALVLMRMSDAVAQVGAEPGMRVHRSWWVADRAVRLVARRGRTVQLDLENGLVAPVSQPYLKAVTGRFGQPATMA